VPRRGAREVASGATSAGARRVEHVPRRRRVLPEGRRGSRGSRGS
jgi:hypothetical protein